MCFKYFDLIDFFIKFPIFNFVYSCRLLYDVTSVGSFWFKERLLLILFRKRQQSGKSNSFYFFLFLCVGSLVFVYCSSIWLHKCELSVHQLIQFSALYFRICPARFFLFI